MRTKPGGSGHRRCERTSWLRSGWVGVLVAGALMAGCVTGPEAFDPGSGLACTAEGDQGSDGPLTTVRISDLGLVGDAATYLAIEHGYFEANGIAIESQPFRSVVDAIPALGQGDLDVATGTLSAAFYNGLAAGLDISVVADSARVAPAPSSHLALVVAAPLQSEIAEYSDLAGRMIAINAPAGGLEVQLATALDAGGLTLDDVDVIHLQFPEMIAGFTSGNVDAAIVPEPFLSIGLASGVFVELAPVGAFYPEHQVSVLMFSGDFAERDDLATAYMCAYLRGTSHYLDAIATGTVPDDLADVLIARTQLDDRALIARIRYHVADREGDLNRASIERDLDYYDEAGYLEAKPQLDDFIDGQILDSARRLLGSANDA
jgi:ABC-type nitrate/sulfonate/bicarbonate transport system substrate-binding protein